MRTGAFVLSVVLAMASVNVARADGDVVRHHRAHHVAAAGTYDPYDVKWHVLGAVLTLVTASVLMPWALQDLDASVKREKGHPQQF